MESLEERMMMSRKKDQAERLLRLRAVESDCYSVCLYLLQDEALAIQAAQEALCDMFRRDIFEPDEAKKTAMEHALAAAGRARAAGSICAMA
jgi:hypothetical protein